MVVAIAAASIVYSHDHPCPGPCIPPPLLLPHVSCRLKQQKLGHQPWSRVEAEAKELLEKTQREAASKKEAKKEANKRAAAIAMARLKTISVGQWLQVRVCCCSCCCFLFCCCDVGPFFV